MANKIPLAKAPMWVHLLGEDMKEAARKGLFSAAQKIVAHIQTEVIPQEDRPPVDTAAYKAGWLPKRVDNGAIITNTLPYAPIIEYGARASNIKPGRAMIDALTKWVRRKGIGGGTTKSGKPKKATAEEARQIAWAIAMSMTRNGIYNGGTGLRILEKAMKRAPKFIEEEIRREMKRVGKE